MTKKEIKKLRGDWRKAVEEGRVVRMVDGNTFRSFATPEAAEMFVRANPEIYAEIVK